MTVLSGNRYPETLTTIRSRGITEKMRICFLFSASDKIPAIRIKNQKILIRIWSLAKKGKTRKLLIHKSIKILVSPLSSFQKCLCSFLGMSLAMRLFFTE
jgi:hypothetical protein